jgi:hypothetical protein
MADSKWRMAQIRGKLSVSVLQPQCFQVSFMLSAISHKPSAFSNEDLW